MRIYSHQVLLMAHHRSPRAAMVVCVAFGGLSVYHLYPIKVTLLSILEPHASLRVTDCHIKLQCSQVIVQFRR